MRMFPYRLTAAGDMEARAALADAVEGVHVPAVGMYENGLLAVVDSGAGSTILQNWDWLVGRDARALLTTGMGDVFFWAGGEVCWLNVQRGSVQSIDPDISWFLGEFLSRDTVVAKVLRKAAFEELTRLNRPLEYHEAFILRPWLILGGQEQPENYAIGDCAVYVDLVGQTLAQVG